VAVASLAVQLSIIHGQGSENFIDFWDNSLGAETVPVLSTQNVLEYCPYLKNMQARNAHVSRAVSCFAWDKTTYNILSSTGLVERPYSRLVYGSHWNARYLLNVALFEMSNKWDVKHRWPTTKMAPPLDWHRSYFVATVGQFFHRNRQTRNVSFVLRARFNNNNNSNNNNNNYYYYY